MQYPYGNPVSRPDHDGQNIVLMPLRNSERPAKLLLVDWNALAERGVSTKWHCAGIEQRYVYCDARGADDAAIVARLIVEAGPGDQVNYGDGDRLNLRRDNLWIRRTMPRR